MHLHRVKCVDIMIGVIARSERENDPKIQTTSLSFRKAMIEFPMPSHTPLSSVHRKPS